MLDVKGIDHIVMTVLDEEATITFYTSVLGLKKITFGEKEERVALQFNEQKINLHPVGSDIEPKARIASPGTLDLCLLCSNTIEEILNLLHEHFIPVEEGPVLRTGATGAIHSVYVRDPDGNLLELSTSIAS